MAYSIFSAVLGMLQFGYNTGVINAPEQVFPIMKMVMIKMIVAWIKKVERNIEP